MGGSWRAFLRGMRRGLGRPVERIDYGPEGQLVRPATKMRPAVGTCPGCGADDSAFCAADCSMIDLRDWRG